MERSGTRGQGGAQRNPGSVPARTSALVRGLAGQGSWGNDYLAGGAQHDMIFGQLGDDTNPEETFITDLEEGIYTCVIVVDP